MAKADKKQPKSVTKAPDGAKSKPVSTKELLAKVKKATVEAVCWSLFFFYISLLLNHAFDSFLEAQACH
jgi:hypothetical protein